MPPFKSSSCKVRNTVYGVGNVSILKYLEKTFQIINNEKKETVFIEKLLFKKE